MKEPIGSQIGGPEKERMSPVNRVRVPVQVFEPGTLTNSHPKLVMVIRMNNRISLYRFASPTGHFQMSVSEAGLTYLDLAVQAAKNRTESSHSLSGRCLSCDATAERLPGYFR